MKIRIGSRGSDLALWQANFVKSQLEELGHEISIQIITTKGDRIQDLSFDKIEGKGFFTKEIEDALLGDEIDVAVHSYKDLETKSPPGLTIGAVSYRENPTDCLLVRKEKYVADAGMFLADGSVIGTSSARRQSLIRSLNPQLNIQELRGNVPTRIQKLRDGQYDAIILASAGIARLELDLSDLEVIELPVHDFVPAPAQGVLGIQIRESDEALKKVLQEIHHSDVESCIRIERDVLRSLDGGCQLPLGAHCVVEDSLFKVHASFAETKSEAAVVHTFASDQAEGFATQIAQSLKNGDL